MFRVYAKLIARRNYTRNAPNTKGLTPKTSTKRKTNHPRYGMIVRRAKTRMYVCQEYQNIQMKCVRCSCSLAHYLRDDQIYVVCCEPFSTYSEISAKRRSNLAFCIRSRRLRRIYRAVGPLKHVCDCVINRIKPLSPSDKRREPSQKHIPIPDSSSLLSSRRDKAYLKGTKSTRKYRITYSGEYGKCVAHSSRLGDYALKRSLHGFV